MMMSQSHNSRRMLPPGNTRKRKQTEADKPDKPIPSNKLLAGYLAHEFLTKGTLFGQMFDPTEDRANSDSSDSIVISAEQMNTGCLPNTELTQPSVRKEHESYGEVASIVKMNGTHIKGIVNPTELSRWIRM